MKKNTFKKLWKYISHDRIRLYFSLFLSAVLAVCVLLAPAVCGEGIDYIAEKGAVDFSGVLKIILLLALIYLINFACGWIISVIMAKIASNTAYALRRDAYENLMKLPVSYFDTTPHGDIVSRLTNDIDAVYEGVYGTGNVLITGIISMLGSLGFMIYLNWAISLIVVVITPFAVLLAMTIAKRTNRFFIAQSEKVGELNGFAEEIISGLQTVKSYNNEAYVREHFRKTDHELYRVGQKAQFYSSLVNPTTRVVNNLSYVFVGCIGGLAAISSGLTVGGISAFLSYSTQFAKPINEISSVTTQIQAASASAQRIFDIIERSPESDESTLGDLKVTEGRVELDHVSFSYDPSRKLIKDLSLNVSPDSVVAIVGATGAGKTTIVNLLMRFYDVDSGKIIIDGTDTSTVKRKSLRREFSMVLQDTYIFEGTIFENIAYGKENATRDEVEAAAKMADAHSFIMRLPEGYDTVIGEKTGGLSQGQMQLLTIARAMLRPSQMLILDEATSSVDTLTEMRIQKAFKAMMAGKTCFVIAHRLSTIKDAGLILVMENGDIVERGRHDELMEKRGVYYNLYSLGSCDA